MALQRYSPVVRTMRWNLSFKEHVYLSNLAKLPSHRRYEENGMDVSSRRYNGVSCVWRNGTDVPDRVRWCTFDSGGKQLSLVAKRNHRSLLVRESTREAV